MARSTLCQKSTEGNSTVHTIYTKRCRTYSWLYLMQLLRQHIVVSDAGRGYSRRGVVNPRGWRRNSNRWILGVDRSIDLIAGSNGGSRLLLLRLSYGGSVSRLHHPTGPGQQQQPAFFKYYYYYICLTAFFPGQPG